MRTEQVNQAFEYAKTRYAQFGIDAEKAIAEMDKLSISLHCWQADDVTGFEKKMLHEFCRFSPKIIIGILGLQFFYYQA